MRTRARLEVRFDYLASNISQIRSLSGGSRILLMTKANSYGLGAKSIIQYCFDHLNIQHFGFATLDEALACSYLDIDYSKIKFYIFSETLLEETALESEFSSYSLDHIIPIIYDFISLKHFVSHKFFHDKPLVLKLDIGMKRFGFASKDLKELVHTLRSHNIDTIDHLMGHFPCAAKKSDEQLTHNQYQDFLKMKEFFKENRFQIKDSSVANSAAIERGIGVQESFVRPGLLAYGNIATKDNPSGWKGRPIGNLICKPLKVFYAQKGDSIGYGGIQAKQEGWMAILPLGYADGVTQSFKKLELETSLGQAIFHGVMNMDISYLQFRDLNLEKKQIENLEIHFFDNNTCCQKQMLQKLKMSAYEIYLRISLRVPRVYKIR